MPVWSAQAARCAARHAISTPKRTCTCCSSRSWVLNGGGHDGGREHQTFAISDHQQPIPAVVSSGSQQGRASSPAWAPSATTVNGQGVDPSRSNRYRSSDGRAPVTDEPTRPAGPHRLHQHATQHEYRSGSPAAARGRPTPPPGRHTPAGRWPAPAAWPARRTGSGRRPGHRRQLGAIGQPDPPDDVQLPQLHRPGAFPTLVVLATPAPLLGLDQPMAHQRPVHTGASRQRHHPVAAQLGQDAARSPARMGPPQRHHPRLHRGWDLVRAGGRPRALVGQPTQTRRGIAPQPPMQGLGGQPRSGAPPPPPWRRRQGPPAQPGSAAPPAPTPPARCRPPPLAPTKAHREEGGTPRSTGDCHPPTGATVAQDPEPRPEPVSQQPEPQRKA
jgi:hypothetical protein